MFAVMIYKSVQVPATHTCNLKLAEQLTGLQFYVKFFDTFDTIFFR